MAKPIAPKQTPAAHKAQAAREKALLEDAVRGPQLKPMTKEQLRVARQGGFA